MTYLQRYRNRPAGGRQFFWNPLARALIVFFLLMALILLAAMQAIPYVLYESAQLDGAGRWRQFLNVTVPSIRNTIVFVVIVSTIGGMQIFTEPLIFGGQNGVTGGASRQYQTVALYLYEQGFRNFEFGYAATIAWVLFGIILIFSVVNLLFTRRIASSE